MIKKLNIFEAAMKYRQIVLAIVVVTMALGIFGLKNMPRNEFPDFTIRQGIVVGIYPGANSKQVEQQLTTKVENYIFGYKEINKAKTYSQSKEGMMIIFVELNNDVKDADKFWSKLRHGLQELKMQVPSDVLALIGNNDFGDTAAFLISMSSKDKTYRQLEESMKELEAEIRRVETVSKIKRYGEQKEKIFVYVNPEKLNEFNINSTTVLTSFKIQESVNYAGELDNGELILPIHLPPRFNSIEDIKEQIVYADPQGNIIRLKDIARIERKYDNPDSYIRNNGTQALLLSLEMQQGNNIVQFGDEVQEIITKFSKAKKGEIDINIISNQPEVVDFSITHFLKEFVIAIIAVIFVTLILLPARIAIVAGFTIPISILIGLGIMWIVGIQLDIVSLAGLIVVLGMVVDNAIVVIDEHVEKLDAGETPWNAAWKAAQELFIPVLSATAAIISAFVPLMIFLTGMSGDFIGSFPLTIAIVLIISMAIAVLMVPFICYVFIKNGLHNNKTNKKSFLDIVQNGYNKGLNLTFRFPKATILGGVLSIILAIFVFTGVKQKMFPEMDRKQFAVEVYLPEGTALVKTEKIIDSLENILSKDNRITNISSFTGTSSPRFHTLYAPHLPAKNYGQLLINTVSNEATVEILKEYSSKYTNLFANAHIKWKQIAMEMFSAPVEVRISGTNIKEIKQAAKKVAKILNENSKTTWIRNDWQEARLGLNININRNKANQLGYAKSMVAVSLLANMQGLPLTKIWENDYPVDVILSTENKNEKNIDVIGNQYIASPLTMQTLPLRSIANVEPEWTEGVIVRRNGVRTLTVAADVVRGEMYSDVFNEISPLVAKLNLSDNIKITYGGEQGETLTTYLPMAYSLGTSIVLIFFILLFQFKTVKRSLLIMSTMLLSLFGAAVGLKIVGYPFGFTSFLGIIGLMGITVRNGIIIIDYAMQLVKNKGLSYKEAAIATGKRRMRPIFLTSLAAAVGVVPMIVSQSPLWGPLGTVICFGLIFGMILTLFVLPVLYWKTA